MLFITIISIHFIVIVNISQMFGKDLCCQIAVKYGPYTTHCKYGSLREKTCPQVCEHQPAHSRSLINAFVIRLLESIISRLATSEFLIF